VTDADEMEKQAVDSPEGLRARKRRQTRDRIIASALRLFLERGFEGATLDAIAETADVARRTLFHYFDSKEAIVQALQSDVEEAFRAALDEVPLHLSPIDAVRSALLAMIGRYESEEAIAIDQFMRSTSALRARKQANYERQEHELFAALQARWPATDCALCLRIVAMVGIGAMRLASERWSDEHGRRPLQIYLVEVFDTLRRELIG